VGKADLAVLLAASFAVFAAITGKNWGYDGRMCLASLPVLLFVFGISLRYSVFLRKSINIRIRGFSASIASELVLYALLVSSLIGMHQANKNLFIVNIKLALAGGYYQRLLPEYLSDVARGWLQADKANLAFWYGTTPENYKITGMAIEKLRTILKLEEISFMTPDVGGLALCCENIKVIDSALLTNSFLARHGYGAFSSYLERTRPDVVETHDPPWSIVSGIYDSAFFRENYLPMVLENNLLWVRRDHIDPILASTTIEKKRVNKVEDVKPLRYGGLDIDRRYRDEANFDTIWSITVK
jgi:fumarate reductase subunit D